MRICVDECVVQFSIITKELSSDLISLKVLLIGFVVLWFWFEHPIYFNLVEEWIEFLWNRITMNLWLWACWKSFVLHVLRVLRVFFVFESLWWKFFGALEAWICRASPIYDLLRFFGPLRSRKMIWMISLRIRSLSSWSSWRLQGLVPTELLNF